MVVIDPAKKLLTLINVVEVEPAKCDEVVQMFITATEKVISGLDGFVSSSIHRSLDGTRVINYAQWESEAALEASRNHPDTQIYYAQVDANAKSFMPTLTQVVDSKVHRSVR
jgi:quinol monooxygenase YgiN